MIRVSKPTTIPSKLSGTGHTEDIRNRQAYDADIQAYRSGKKEIKIKDGIYNHKTIKQILRRSQHHKCCFCEKEQHDEDGAVEHYRPKCGYKSAKMMGKELKKPGYYWLCYIWENLYFVCDACNREKANYFPLTNERDRAKSHHDNITSETPYILDPAGVEDPRAHISFDYGYIMGTSKFGEQTIKICGLDRAALNEKRAELVGKLKLYILIFETPVNDIITKEIKEEVRSFLLDCQKPTAEFSATAIDYLRRRNFQLI